MGHETCEGCDKMGVGPAYSGSHLGLRWSSLGATKRVRGVTKWGGRKRTHPLETSVELLMGHETCDGCAEMGGPHGRAATWAFGELPMGHETCEGCAEMGGGPHGRAATWAFGELTMGDETCEGCAEM